METTFLKTAKWWVDEIKSHFMTILALVLFFASIDGFQLLQALYAGQFELVTKDAVILLTYRSGIKALLTILFPSLFPLPKTK